MKQTGVGKIPGAANYHIFHRAKPVSHNGKLLSSAAVTVD
jgi:hypothetical protein